MNVVNESAIPVKPAGVRLRLDSVDLLRGFIMVVMALDHVRDFFNSDTFDPTDLTRTYPALFLTRWITHFCAPVFCFLAGTGAFLSLTRGKTKQDLSWFLLTRGIWLVFLELTIVRSLGWTFEFQYHLSFAWVIWALGWSMIALAALIHLPIWGVTAFGVLMIGTHNLFDSVKSESFGTLSWLWTILHQPGRLHLFPHVYLGVGYPLIPWIGVMAAGYGFGALLLAEREQRRKRLLSLGACLTVAFITIRLLNIYGDAQPWSLQRNLLFTIFSFVNCTKYPPSLLYLLMTLGPALIVLALLDRETPAMLRPFLVFGRVPLFYYLLHIPLIHGLAVLFAYIKYGRADWLMTMPESWNAWGELFPRDYGYSLPIVYLVWIGVILPLYPLCRWFAEVKRRRSDAWLSYF